MNKTYFEGKNVLVPGGAGFVGSNLITYLLDLGANVTATYHINPPQIKNKNVNWFKGDLTSSEFCSDICKDQQIVFMCAANTSGASAMIKTPLVHVTPNVVMNSYMLESAHKAKVQKFVFISSNTVYPLSDFPLKEEDSVGELFDKYFCVGSMKRFSEILCEMYSKKIKNPTTTIIVRPGNLYGDYDDFDWSTSHSTAALIRRGIEKHDPLEVWGDGTDRKDLMYISDFIDGILLIAEKVENFDIINLASGQAYSIAETLETILKVLNYKADIQYDTTKPTMIPKRLINIDKIKTLFNFYPKISLVVGIQKTIEWYKDNRKV